MGMFDTIDYTMPCPYCGEPVKDWQSKWDVCNLRTFAPKEFIDRQEWVKPGERYSTWATTRKVEMHTSCPKCDTWLEINITQYKKEEKGTD